MVSNDFIADKIEEVVGRMFAYFKSIETGVTEYSILFNPQQSKTWFIVLFFESSDILKNNLTNGICYQLHSYLLNELTAITEILDIERLVSFEQGNRPIAKSGIDSLFNKLLTRLEGQKNVSNKENIQTCGTCGHNFDNHKLLCNLGDREETPKEGWIICPEENCNCFQTWSANYKTSD